MPLILIEVLRPACHASDGRVEPMQQLITFESNSILHDFSILIVPISPQSFSSSHAAYSMHTQVRIGRERERVDEEEKWQRETARDLEIVGN